MFARIAEIIRKEFLQALREPRMRVVLFLPPLIQLLLFGYAVNLDVEHIQLAWMDLDRTPESRELEAAFRASRYFDLVSRPAGEEQVRELLDHGRAQVVVRVLPGFARDVLRGRTAAVQVLVEGINSNTASLVSNYASQVVAGYAQQRLAGRQNQLLMARGAQAPVNTAVPVLTARTRVWFNSELKSRNYFVPGVVVNIIMMVTIMLTALAIVREKEIGTMEQLMVTPIRPIELIVGKTLPFAAVGLIDMMLVTTAAMVVFGIPFRGHPLLLLGSTILFLMTTLGAGLFLSTISSTQQQAMLATFIFVMPAFMLSGFAFPIRNMPEPVQWLTYLNPVRYFMEIVRGLFLKGSGLDVLWPQVLALAVYGAAVLGSSALRFRKRLD
ncbi:MAG: ABC transporter permease [Acidobacteria bacterium]|nr:ABC transporter permease [Acidobacteriota bacterium]